MRSRASGHDRCNASQSERRGPGQEVIDSAFRRETCGAPRSIHGFFGALYPVYVRGLAYLSAKQGSQGVAEFQKILTHRGIVQTEPIGSLAQLGLARAYPA